MSKLIHLIRADLKHIAWLLLLYVALAAAVAYPTTNLADGLVDPETGFFRLKRMVPFLLILYVFVGAILTQRLLVKDSLCDVDAFWLSKPFDGWQLLASKGILLLLVYFAIPGFFIWIVTLNSGVSTPWGALIRYGYWILWYAPVIVFFSVHTKGLSTMLVGVVSLAALMFVGYNFFAQFYIFGGPPKMGGYFHLAAYLVYLVSVSIAIVLPFLSRHRELPRRIAGAGVLVTLTIPLLGLMGYVGPSDRNIENERIGHSLVIEEPVFHVNTEESDWINLKMENPSLDIESPEGSLLFHTAKGVRASFRTPGKPDVILLNSQKGKYAPSMFAQSLADSLRELKVWDLQSVLGLHKSVIHIEDNFQPLRTGDLDDPAGEWELFVGLNRFEIVNVMVVPIKNDQEIVHGGIRTMLRQTGYENDYSKYMLVEYTYGDYESYPPIRFRENYIEESLHRVYFLKGKSGRIWQPETRLESLISVMQAFGLGKRYGYIGAIEPITEGPGNEELELVAIDVRTLGNIGLQVDARVSSDS